MKSRLITAVALASALTMALSGVVAAADIVVGQHGHYIFTDGNTTSTAGANCRYYMQNSSTWRIYRIVARPPSVWWMDTNSDITTQHGRVGWRVIILHKSMASSTWLVLKRSGVQFATAYEDQLNPYGSSTKAPFTRIAVDFNGGAYEVSHQFMARIRVNWYRADGSIRGYAIHDVQYYNEVISGHLQGLAPNSWCIDAYQVAPPI